jgi:replicative DNA helicase
MGNHEPQEQTNGDGQNGNYSQPNLQTVILSRILSHDKFCRTVLPHIKPEYFEHEHRTVYEIALDFIQTYNRLPTPIVLDIEFRKSEKADERGAVDVINLIQEMGRVPAGDGEDHQWLLDSTEEWCKSRAVLLAIMESITIIDGKSRENKSQGMIPEILTQALAVSFDTNVGHDYLEDSAKRYEFYHTPQNRIPFTLDMFNVITKGGIKRKTLNIILAGTAVGKSMAMCHLASDDLKLGRNVLYITLEMSEEAIAERIDANLMDTDCDNIPDLSRASFESKMESIKSKTTGRLMIKEYPTATAHCGHFRALLAELKMKKNFIPDIIYVDYINICASSRIKGLGGNVNSYSLVKSIAEELRGLAVEFNVPLWSATQVTRAGFNDSDIGLTDTSESWGLPGTADLMIALISTEQLEKLGQLMVKQLKNRYNNSHENRRFMVGIDRAKMRMYDLDDPTANLMADSKNAAPPVRTTPFSTGVAAKTNKFSNLKV